MTTPRYAHTATLLPDGKTLIVGGVGPELDRPYGSADRRLFSGEIYDPSTGTFSATAEPIQAAVGAAALLAGGKVLIAGGASVGAGAVAELYDPASGTFAATGQYAGGVWRYALFLSEFTTTLLADGRVLIAGGGEWGGDFSDFLGEPSLNSMIPPPARLAPPSTARPIWLRSRPPC